MSFLSRALTRPVRRPWPTLVVALVLTALAAASAARLRPTTSLEALFPSESPAVAALHRLLEDFAVAEDLLLLVTLPEDAPDDPAPLLAFAERFARAALDDPETAPMVESVSWQGGAQAKRLVDEVIRPGLLLYLSDEGIEKLRARLSPAGIAAQIRRNEALLATPSLAADAIAKRVLRDPLHLDELLQEALAPVRENVEGRSRGGAFLSPDGRSLLVRVTGAEPASKIGFTRALMPAMRRTVEAAEPGDLRIELSGAYALAELSDREIRSDMTLSLAGSVFLLTLLFLAVYRSPWIFVPALAPVMIGIVFGFGGLAFFVSTFTLITAVVGAILAGLAVDYAIHYLSHYASRRSRGATPVAAVDIRHGPLTALLAALVTSLVAFASVAASSITALRHFALVGIFGLAAAFVATLVVLPALLGLLERRSERRGRPGFLDLRLHPEVLLGWIVKHRRWCLLLTAGVLIAATLTLAATRGRSLVSSELSPMQPRPNPPLETQEKIAELFGASPDSLVIYLRAATGPELVELAHQVSERLTDGRLQQTELGVYGLASLLPSPAAAARNLDAARAIDPDRVVADFRAALADSVFDPDAFTRYEATLRAMLRPAAVPGLAELDRVPELAATILPRADRGEDGTQQALTLVSLSTPFADRVARDAGIAEVRLALADLEGATLTGLKVLAADLQRSVQDDLLRILGLAAVIVTLWLLVVFRHWVDALLALLPAVFGLLILVAVLKATGTGLNTMNLVALPLVVGLGVDDGIFLVSAYARRRFRRGDAHHHLADEMGASVHAITMTSATTSLAFGSLMLTSTPAISSLGLVLAVGIAGAWFASLFLLVPLLLSRAEHAAAHPPA